MGKKASELIKKVLSGRQICPELETQIEPIISHEDVIVSPYVMASAKMCFVTQERSGNDIHQWTFPYCMLTVYYKQKMEVRKLVDYDHKRYDWGHNPEPYADGINSVKYTENRKNEAVIEVVFHRKWPDGSHSVHTELFTFK